MEKMLGKHVIARSEGMLFLAVANYKGIHMALIWVIVEWTPIMSHFLHPIQSRSSFLHALGPSENDPTDL